MNAFEYFVQVNGYLILFYSFFYLLLKNETFFNLNRAYLLGGAVLSFLIPLSHSAWINDLLGLQPVVETKMFIHAWLVPVVVVEDMGPMWTTADWIVSVYLLVAAALFLRFVFRLVYLFVKPAYENSAAYSFFNRIFVSESLAGYPAVHKHEETHVRHYHSVDVVLLELISIIVWYNPVVYFYRRSVKHIHEFIADEAACREEKKEDYAMLLLSNTLGVPVSRLVNNFFNQSLLKKRIMMLHKKKSNRSALLKYGLSAPLFICMLVFSSARIDAESREIVERADMAEPITTLQKIEEKGTRLSLKKQDLTSPAPPQLADTSKHNKVVQDFSTVDVLPDFPGGITEFYKYIGMNFKLPEAARRDSISGRLILSFVVEKDGALSDIKVLRDLGAGTGEEAMRVLATSPKWTPGMQNGKPVRVQYTLPVAINAGARKARASQSGTDSVGSKANVSGEIGAVGYSSAPDKKPLYIVDGKESTEAASKSIPKKIVERIEVYKDAAGIAMYGEKGKNGVIKITTRQYASTFGAPAEKSKALVVIDGKKMTGGFNLNTLNPNLIDSLVMLKGAAAVGKYGEEGRDGVIVIQTKK